MNKNQSSNEYLDKPLFSIVIPSRNEEKDIAATLDKILAIEYEPKEIIVVDDSTDNTPNIVMGYESQGVRLLHRTKNQNGCCGARNLGMQTAQGEIIVLMNSDNRPQTDFLDRILVHYQKGADFVLVGPVVINKDTMWGRYVQASGAEKRGRKGFIQNWSEGFSCRRSTAEAVGYIPGDFPIPFCRDTMIGKRLSQGGFKKCVDRTIPLAHVAPNSLDEYWHNQLWRGTFSPLHAHYFSSMPIPFVIVREMLRSLRTVLLYLLVIPVLWRGYRHARHTKHRWRNLPSLFWVGLVRDTASVSGGFKGVLKLIQEEGFGFSAK